MSKDNIVFIGLDTHKASTEVAYVLDSRESTPEHRGKIATTKQGLVKLARQFESKHPKATLHFGLVG